MVRLFDILYVKYGGQMIENDNTKVVTMKHGAPMNLGIKALYY